MIIDNRYYRIKSIFGYRLRALLLTHIGQKQHKCTRCNFSANQADNLRKHITTHTGEKQYSCTQCNKSFSQARSMKRHQLAHTGEKKHWCTQCIYSTNRADSLRGHIMLHTGEKPQRCTKCNFSCITAGHLNNHMENVHLWEGVDFLSNIRATLSSNRNIFFLFSLRQTYPELIHQFWSYFLLQCHLR